MSQLTLADYPAAIAAAETAVLRAAQAARVLGEAVERRRAEFKGIVATQLPAGKGNDGQRKNLLNELELTDGEFLGLQAQLQEAKDALVEAQIEADLQGNLFRVARLEAEGAIAQSRLLAELQHQP